MRKTAGFIALLAMVFALGIAANAQETSPSQETPSVRKTATKKRPDRIQIHMVHPKNDLVTARFKAHLQRGGSIKNFADGVEEKEKEANLIGKIKFLEIFR